MIGFTALLCIAVGAGAAGALNMWYEADIDAVMTRTAGRPIPQGRVAPGEALGFGLTLAGFAVVVMGLLVNPLAAALLAFTIFFYAVVYTMWLKRSTPQNIVIGGAAGAFPPDDRLGGGDRQRRRSSRCLLFLIIFVWTPPHFWALSLAHADDYARARVPMLPVVAGAAETRRQILLYCDPAGAGRRDAVAARLCRRRLRRDRAGGRRADGRCSPGACAPSATTSAPARRRNSCSPSRFSISSSSSPSCWSRADWAASSAGPWRESAREDVKAQGKIWTKSPNGPASCSPRSRSAAGARARSRSRSRSARWSCCSTSSRW